MTAFDHTHRWRRIDGQPNLFRCSCGDYGHATGNNIVRRPPPKPKKPSRVCKADGCERSLDHRHEQAEYCSRRCQGRQRKNFSVSAETYEALLAEAKRRGCSIAAVVEDITKHVGLQ